MSLLPQNNAAPLEYVEPSSKTWLLDHKTGRIHRPADGLQAVVQAAYCALQTQRYRHLIYSWQYGSELHDLVGKDPAFVFSEAKRMIKDALQPDTRITDIRDFALDGQVIRFTIDTIFGVGGLETEVIGG